MSIIYKHFGRLTVIKKIQGSTDGQSTWNCVCTCGNTIQVKGFSLLSKNTKSCGCLKKELWSKANFKHGMSDTPLHIIWQSMNKRCNNKNSEHYNSYGGRGIKVCKEWTSFIIFAKDMGSKPSSKHSLERRNNNKGYNKNNCYWATPSEQARNKRNTILLTYNNKTQCLIDWANELDIHYHTISSRLKAGLSIQEALSTKPNQKISKPGYLTGVNKMLRGNFIVKNKNKTLYYGKDFFEACCIRLSFLNSK